MKQYTVDIGSTQLTFIRVVQVVNPCPFKVTNNVDDSLGVWRFHVDLEIAVTVLCRIRRQTVRQVRHMESLSKRVDNVQ